MKQDHVLICLHGFIRTGASMWWMALHLRSLNYASILTPTMGLHLHNWEKLTESLHAQIQETLRTTNTQKIDVVTYSMGGLLIRALLTRYPTLPIQRIVMIAPPNRGAQMAEFVRNWLPIHELGWDPLQPLCPEQQADLSEPPEHIPVGIIAGYKGNGKGYNILLSEDNDGKVCLSETRLERTHEFICIKGRHPSLIMRPLAIQLVNSYLQKNHFGVD